MWSMGAGAALTLATLCALMWAAERHDVANLAFSLVAVAVAGLARTEIGMMHSTNVTEYADWSRLSHLPLFCIIVGLMVFARYYLGTQRGWLTWTIVALWLAVLAGDFFWYPELNWQGVYTLGQFSLLGEEVTVAGQVVPLMGQWLAVAGSLLAVVFLAESALPLWRSGGAEERRRASIVAVGIAAPLLLSIVFVQMSLMGAIRIPSLGTPLFLFSLAVLAVELSRIVRLDRSVQVELDQLRRELARAGRISALGQLAAALAHELSQPLAAILRNSEAAELHLESPTPDLAELRAIISDIHKDDTRAGEVIARMRSLIKGRRVDMRPLAPEEFIQDALLLARAEAAARQVALYRVIAPGLPLVSGDRVHISQVLLNLIINAMDAMDACPVSSRLLVIEAHRDQHQHMIEIIVSDSGPGVRPEMVDKIFDPFFTTKPEGMGMGLPVSRSIIEAHGGRLWAETGVRGMGLTFHFTLPLAARSGA
jgi:signal transduction histidine kinase